MSHVTGDAIHGYKNRALSITVDVDTDESAADWSSVTWRIGNILEKTDLTPEDGGDGVTVDIELSASDLNLAQGVYVWELIATIDSEVRTRGVGKFHLDAEPTTSSS